MSTVSSHEESNAEDVDDLDNLVDGIAVEEEEDNNQEQTEVVEVDGEGNPDDEAQEVPARADPKPKRVIKNPQPKLNAETLKGPRGIHTLPQVFEKVKFKGKGYEERDLNLLMKTYEYWCHRLFPKFSFDDCLARLEKLGTKKAVQTHIKKIRYDLLMEETPQLVSDNEEAEVADEFDEIAQPAEEPIQLTEEQLERIRLNKEKALKRLQNAKNAAAVHLPISQPNAQNSELNSEITVDDNNERQQNSEEMETVENNEPENHEGINVELLDKGGETVFENETNAMETKEATNNFTDKENVNLDSESVQSNNDEDQEMDIESMLDVIAKGP